MNVLGLNLFGHNTGAAIITPQKTVSISEERLSGVKNDGSLPFLSIQYCLDFTKLTLDEIDLMVFDKDFGRFFNERMQHFFESKFSWFDNNKIVGVDHHTLHAWSSLTLSDFSDAAILVIDGGGSLITDYRSLPKIANCHPSHVSISETTKVSMFRYIDNKLHRIKIITKSPGIASLYSTFTQYLGFGKYDAGKTMGLAAFAKKENMIDKFSVFNITDHLCGDLDYTYNELMHDTDILAILFDHPSRTKEINLPNEFYNEIAGLIQNACEDFVLSAVKHLKNITQAETLIYSGGVALNCKANQIIENENIFKKNVFFPASSDAGIPLGAAVYAWNYLGGNIKNISKNNCFYGKVYTKHDIETTISNISESDQLIIKRYDDTSSAVAEELEKGHIVGIFYGRSELGPRALGNRSILANSKDIRFKNELNERVKKRESWRPFGPAVLMEDYSQYFDGNSSSKGFMNVAANVLPDVQNTIPAAIHVDGTARPQTVTYKEHPFLYKILSRFKQLTGVGVIINTSFNLAGDPIVETPSDAINCFLKSGLDVLAFENFLIKKV